MSCPLSVFSPPLSVLEVKKLTGEHACAVRVGRRVWGGLQGENYTTMRKALLVKKCNLVKVFVILFPSFKVYAGGPWWGVVIGGF